MLSRLKPGVTEKLSPIGRALAAAGIKPNHLTALGLLFGFASAVTVAWGRFTEGAILLLLSGVCDLLDGLIARSGGLETSFGGFIDSVADRYVDIAIFTSFGLAGIDWLTVVAAMSGALMVSYTRARAEKIVERCDVGIAERGERMLILAAGMLTGYAAEATLMVAVLSHLTALQRIVYTFRKSRG